MQANEITDLLHSWHLDMDRAWHELVPLIYQEMRKLARYHLRQQGSAVSFQTTELLHETLIKLEAQDRVQWADRRHFFAVATTVMRRVLLDHARAQTADKRGHQSIHFQIDDTDLAHPTHDRDLIALDQALTDLARLDPPLARLVELRVFGGLTIEETADLLGCSPATVKRDWTTARLWLFDYLVTV
ncbi:MAG: sigma-70 family RNA polymerase sigma factor [Acidobacteria bacterium]|nr:sigma-70 family RNA polymerase sigma factor [Acidobacteriota bacterium]